jgi:hypothetical protein
MGMSIHLVGFMEPTDDYAKKVTAYHACEAAGIDVPDELGNFFDYERPSTDGMKVDISGAVVGDVMRKGKASVYLSKLPEGVTRIDVVAS